jgi:hypothetical protein
MMIEPERQLDRAYVASSVRLADAVVAGLAWALAHAHRGPVVVCAPDLKSLAKAEEIGPATALLVVGAHSGLTPWISAFRPECVGGTVIPVNDRVVSDPAVWAAMESLTDVIDSGTGLAHPADRIWVTEGLLELSSSGHAFDPDELMAAAFSLNWRGTAAWDLRVLARQLNAQLKSSSASAKSLRKHPQQRRSD